MYKYFIIFSLFLANSLEAKTTSLSIGQNYGGGFVAYILVTGDPGYDVSEQHGLIVSLNDLSSNAVWGCSGMATGDTRTTIGAGAANTLSILKGCTASGSPATLCHDYNRGGYTDWYLPSKDELNKIYLFKKNSKIKGFASNSYWSSSEYAGNYVWTQNFSTGGQGGPFDYKLNSSSVRAVRAF